MCIYLFYSGVKVSITLTQPPDGVHTTIWRQHRNPALVQLGASAEHLLRVLIKTSRVQRAGLQGQCSNALKTSSDGQVVNQHLISTSFFAFYPSPPLLPFHLSSPQV